MGYTTRFNGKFALDKLPSAEVIVQLKNLEGADGRKMAALGAPDAYCQWDLTKDCQHIEWDGGEKFYEYVEWLQWIIDRILKPNGITLSGSVNYSGEDTKDNGVLVVQDGEVKQIAHADLPYTLEELQSFKAFVEASPLGREVVSETSGNVS